jgi:hypothetical protein
MPSQSSEGSDSPLPTRTRKARPIDWPPGLRSWHEACKSVHVPAVAATPTLLSAREEESNDGFLVAARGSGMPAAPDALNLAPTPDARDRAHCPRSPRAFMVRSYALHSLCVLIRRSAAHQLIQNTHTMRPTCRDRACLRAPEVHSTRRPQNLNFRGRRARPGRWLRRRHIRRAALRSPRLAA